MRSLAASFVLASLALAGCGASAFSCATPAAGACAEIDNPPSGSAPQEQQQCAQQGGTYHDGPCDRKGALGGCELTFQGVSFTLTDWFYPSAQIKTTADVQNLCAQQMSTFVAP